MGDSREQTIDQLTVELGRCIYSIDHTPTNRHHWKDLYNTALGSLPHLSDREETWFPMHNITGYLGNKYEILYGLLFGFTSIVVVDLSRLEESPLVRTYHLKGAGGLQLLYDVIVEVDSKTQKKTVVHRNTPFDFLHSKRKV
jgi:hypothetical protein